MKPEWKDAPEWANWLAMDLDGRWYWYEAEPVLYVGGSRNYGNRGSTKWIFAGEDAPLAGEKEQRP